ncbi:MAG: lipopolysaccharide transport periplasmic protein LptA [Xanthomonadales bacterium]|jgi:lipopolysaccharide export system protein LptA|nr:lipopolysaccharide transport periplasmic protein LptA [Xanthomonadales bacterium]
MKFCNHAVVPGLCLLLACGPLHALKTDRQQPLDVKADSTGGTLGDGISTLQGNVEIRQGSLYVKADVANVSKLEGKVNRIELTGSPVHLEQEIEAEGLVSAEAENISYEVATGIVTLTGAADVAHPQYRISGEKLIYDMNLQHFQGNGGEENGRIQIRLDPEVLPGNEPVENTEAAKEGSGG